MTLINVLVAWFYACEPHSGSNCTLSGSTAQWRARPSPCFPFYIKVCSEIIGEFLHLLQAARVGGLWLRFGVILT